MLQNIKHFGSNYLIAQNHVPPACSWSGLWNWKCKYLLAQQCHSKHETKAMVFFLILTYQRTWIQQTYFQSRSSHLDFLLKTFKFHMTESLKFRKNYTPSSTQEVKQCPREHQLCNPPLQLTGLKKVTASEKGHTPFAFSSNYGQGRVEVTSFPIPSHAFPSHQLMQSCRHKPLQNTLFWWQIKSHSWVVLWAHKHCTNAVETVTAYCWGQQQ